MFLKNHKGAVITIIIALVMGFIMAVAALFVDKLAFNYSNLFKIWAMISHSILLVSLFVPYKAWGEALAEKAGCTDGTPAFKLVSGIVPSLVLNTFITVLVSAANILYNELIPHDAQMGEWIAGMLHDWPIMFVISYAASFFAGFVGEKVAERCDK